MTEATTVALPGDAVRVVLQGARGTYSIDGDIVASSHKGVHIRMSTRSEPFRFPATSIVSIEVTKQGHSKTVELPPRLETLLHEFRIEFNQHLTRATRHGGQNALPALLSAADRLRLSLYDLCLRETAGHLVAALQELIASCNATTHGEVEHHKD